MHIKIINPHNGTMMNSNHLLIVIMLFFIHLLWASGGFDHGTATGKGKLQIDLTWNPFNYFENGQSYVVFGYGITNKIDLHGYYADHGNYKNGVDSYYYGIFYQFVDSRYIDLATAIGKRKMMDLNYSNIFFPQILYNIKLGKDYTIGGSLVIVRTDKESLFVRTKNKWLTIDVALFIPLTKYFHKIKQIDEVKIGLGAFLPGFNNNYLSEAILSTFSQAMLPTYSIDIKLKNLFNN